MLRTRNAALATRHSQLTLARRSYATPASGARKKRLVVLGTGWGGYAFLKSLTHATCRTFDVKVISPTTSFSFTPLLAQASCATLDFRSAVEPIHSNAWMEYHHAWCDAVDLQRKRIELTSAFNLPFRLSDPLLHTSSPQQDQQGGRAKYTMEYDYLVVSVGSYNQTFGTQGVKENALFLKDVSDARAIRWRILGLFEAANARFNAMEDGDKEAEDEVRRLLTFVVVGGGPTGSEFAAELHDLIKADLARLYPKLRAYPSIRLLDAGSTILSSFDAGLAEYAMNKFARDGISVQLHAKIQRVERDAVVLEGEQRIGAGMVVWSTGITTSPLIEAFRGVGKEDRTGKVLTNDTLNVLVEQGADTVGGSVLNPSAFESSTADKGEKGELVPLDSVFALGDCASQLGTPLPATAQVATQKGTFLAHLFNTHLAQPSPAKPKPFEFANKGSMASIGSGKALIDSPVKKESGALAWILWRSAYTIMSMSWRNRFLVPANWVSNVVFGRDVGRF
ncbi:related to NDE1-mitochondrial cytosolically directed NADH dehydrogenase [Sporisorium reilianum SRZ2]|uniref:Related to NDE1-mitochondrial cytosolically directed NADH dehydrogenase n=1 Tax=Sporisorium reilianum (strain SRZ2) TaxID=999809 RepID=E6ZUB1_SPORE|nr:related to NDE1-mitochondrial cytosolically directed NADH dehydrogenase [Sporisorium reilianum SRZ2]